MTVALEQLRRWRPTVLRDVAAILVIERVLLEQVLAEVIASRLVAGRWTGAASVAATAEAEAVARAIRALCLALSATESALGRAAESLDAAKGLVRRADALAVAAGGRIDPSGRLVLPPRLERLDDPVMAAVGAREEERIRWEVGRLLDRALAVAGTADRELARSLAAAVVDDACFPAPVAAAPLGPPTPALRGAREALPFATAAWWRGLSESQREWVLRERPEWAGPSDGVPAAARHRANLLLLARAERAAARRLQVELDSRPGDALLGVGLEGRAVGQKERQRVEDLRALREVIERDDGVQRQLLLVDDSGPMVKVAVAVGDVDTAEHVTTFVGGLTTTVRSDLRRYEASFVDERDKAKRLGGGADLAVVTWMGYPAPQATEVLAPNGRSVLSDRVARENAGALAAFVNGIDASREVRPHQTLWAHSYGSVVGGFALLRNTGVDDVVLFGSPGVAFTSLSQAGLKPGALNVLRADWDLVAYSGWHLTDPADIPGVSLLSTGSSKPSGTNQGLPSTGHSQYLRPGSTSEHNLIAVAIDRPDLRVRDGSQAP